MTQDLEAQSNTTPSPHTSDVATSESPVAPVTEAGPPEASEPKPTQASKRTGIKDGKDEKKPKRRQREVALGTAVDEALAEAQAFAGDENVVNDVDRVEKDRAAAGQSIADPGFNGDRLRDLKLKRKLTLAALVVTVDHCCRAVSMTVNGKAFVAKSRGATTPHTAENLLRDATPALLGHNQPLLEAVRSALADHDAVQAQLDAQKIGKRTGRTGAKLALDRLKQSVNALNASIRRAKALAAREALTGGSPAPQGDDAIRHVP
jgi:hypothetical protein